MEASGKQRRNLRAALGRQGGVGLETWSGATGSRRGLGPDSPSPTRTVVAVLRAGSASRRPACTKAHTWRWVSNSRASEHWAPGTGHINNMFIPHLPRGCCCFLLVFMPSGAIAVVYFWSIPHSQEGTGSKCHSCVLPQRAGRPLPTPSEYVLVTIWCLGGS